MKKNAINSSVKSKGKSEPNSLKASEEFNKGGGRVSFKFSSLTQELRKRLNDSHKINTTLAGT